MSDRYTRSTEMRARLRATAAALSVLVALATPAVSQAEEVTATGCAQAGVETGCIVLMAQDGRLYNITAAQPKPAPGTAGTVTGTTGEGASSCMQGILLSPATWQPKPGAACPAPKVQ